MHIETLLKKLIGFKTVSEDQQMNRKALGWIEKQLFHLPLHLREHRYSGYPSLVLTTQKTHAPKLWLQAHLDVVPGSPDVFVPKVKQQKLYGRGAFDMKFAIAAYMDVLLSLGEDLQSYNVGMMLTCDEEIGGRNGVRQLLFTEKYRGDMCFLPDGGEDWKFESSAKGFVIYRVESHGKTAHGARPWQGRDANAQLVAYLSRLTEVFRVLAEGNPDAHPYPTLTIGTMRGGVAMNQVPQHAEAQLDIRYPKTTRRGDIRRMLEAAREPRSGIVLRELHHSGPYANDVNDVPHRLFADIVKRIRGRRPGTVVSHGSSDARHFRNLDIPTILIRPRGGGQHSEQEWISLPDLDDYRDALREFVQKTARID